MLETFPVPTWPLWRLMQLLQTRDAPHKLHERLARLEATPADDDRHDQIELLRARLDARLGQRELRPDELADTLALLAHAYADNDLPDRGLYWLRRSREIRRAAQVEQEHVRLRVAARERDRDARRLEEETQRLHAKRLAVVGRLMAQIYHALRAPLTAAHDTLVECLAPGAVQAPELLAARLRQIEARIDEAARLTRRLRMFSYRATPQIVGLDLALALREAWDGLATGSTAAAPALALRGTAPAVKGDAQRLGVLLRILLIELQRLAGGRAPQVELRARGGVVRTLFTGQVVAKDGRASVGQTFCEEIALEMQGRLRTLRSRPGEFHLELELPADA